MSRSAAEAGAAAGPDSGEPGRDLLAVRLGESRFGLWIDEVLEIVETPPISKLPLAVDEVAGVTSVRGDLVPVLDLGVRLLGTPARRPGRLVLVRHDASDSVVALLVDAVETLVAMREGDVRETPAEAEAELPPSMVVGVAVQEAGVITILHLGAAAAPPSGATEEG